MVMTSSNYLEYNYLWDCGGIDNVTLRLWKFSDFCSRHTVGVVGDDIMFHILVENIITDCPLAIEWVPIPSGIYEAFLWPNMYEKTQKYSHQKSIYGNCIIMSSVFLHNHDEHKSYIFAWCQCWCIAYRLKHTTRDCKINHHIAV